VNKGNYLINIQKSFSFPIKPDLRTRPSFLAQSGPLIHSTAATWAPALPAHITLSSLMPGPPEQFRGRAAMRSSAKLP
jgi:hypothetical protein